MTWEYARQLKAIFRIFKGKPAMKHSVWLVALVLAVLLCACGKSPVPAGGVPPPESQTAQTPPAVTPAPESSQTPSETPEPTPVTESTPAPESSPDPELHYRTTQTYDPETGIRRTTLDPQGYSLSLFFEVPVFEEEGEGYQKINRFFDDLERQFFSAENESLIYAWEIMTRPEGVHPTGEQVFHYERWASIGAHTDKLVSVFIGYEWFMGGVADYGGDSYTFRIDTGELVKLTDLVDESEEELTEMIFAALEERNDQEEQERGTRSIELDRLREYALDDFDFSVDRDGTVWIDFDKYEAAYGAYGSFDIELPITLSPKF